jgi:ABC-type Fe3+/spermidine/putrescine transport system ATPase subunit
MPDGRLLKVSAVDAFYGDFQALFGVSLNVGAGQIVAVIGANGAGKSTLLKCIAGLMHPSRGEILFENTATTNTPAFEALKRGIALVPEGRRLFPSLTVEGKSADWRPIASCRPVDVDARLRAVSRSRRTAKSSRACTLGRPATNGGHRARIDVQSETAAV